MSGIPGTRDELAIALAEAERLRLQVASLLSTHEQLSSLLVTADTRVGDVMKLLIAVRALIESRDAAAALAAVQDILVNVVGASEFTVYRIAAVGRMLVPVAAVGAHPSAPVPLDRGWLGDVVRLGALSIGSPEDAGGAIDARRGVAAVVPLRVLDRVVGAIVITRVLPHREPLDGCDREILGLLGVYAATAIIAAGRRSRWRALPAGLS